MVLSKLKEFEKNGIAVQATAFGNKGVGVLSRIGAKLVSQEVQLGDKPQLDRLLGAIKVQLDAYLEGRIDALYVASTRFVNTMKQEPLFLRLLPLASGLEDPYQTGAESLAKTSEVKSDYSWDYIYEPDARSVIDDLLQRYVEGLLYQPWPRTWLRAVGPDGRHEGGVGQRQEGHRRSAAGLQQDPPGRDHQRKFRKS